MTFCEIMACVLKRIHAKQELFSGAGGGFLFFCLYPSIGSQILLVAQFKRFFLLFFPIVPSQQTEALPAAKKPANSLQRHSNWVRCPVLRYPGLWNQCSHRLWVQELRKCAHCTLSSIGIQQGGWGKAYIYPLLPVKNGPKSLSAVQDRSHIPHRSPRNGFRKILDRSSVHELFKFQISTQKQGRGATTKRQFSTRRIKFELYRSVSANIF